MRSRPDDDGAKADWARRIAWLVVIWAGSAACVAAAARVMKALMHWAGLA